MKRFLRVILIFIVGGLIGLSAIFLVNKRIESQAAGKIMDSITKIPVENPPRVAIVLGSKVWENGEPSDALYDRIVRKIQSNKAKAAFQK